MSPESQAISFECRGSLALGKARSNFWNKDKHHQINEDPTDSSSWTGKGRITGFSEWNISQREKLSHHVPLFTIKKLYTSFKFARKHWDIWDKFLVWLSGVNFLYKMTWLVIASWLWLLSCNYLKYFPNYWLFNLGIGFAVGYQRI